MVLVQKQSKKSEHLFRMKHKFGVQSLRKCISCGVINLQSEMIRLMYSEDSVLTHAPNGKGRGAYVCSELCLKKAKQQKKIKKALRIRKG